MLIAIDAGNTRIKWALHDGQAWRRHGHVETHAQDLAQALSQALQAMPERPRVAACNVAGSRVADAVETALARAGFPAPSWLVSSPECCGVRNHYQEPARLGADRWAALIGARGLVDSDCLLVSAGTATTIDRLSASGDFLGGVILPGFDLMRRALAGNTAQLPLVSGNIDVTPTNTADAIASGCLFAQVGAIERLYSAIADRPEACCLLTGGGASLLAENLSIPLRRVEHLIPEGLRRFAGAGGE